MILILPFVVLNVLRVELCNGN